MNEINLLRQSESMLKKPRKLERILRLISMVLLSMVGLLSLALFILNVSSPLTTLAQEEATLLSQVTAYQDRFNNNLIIQDRLKHISAILSKRSNYDEKINKVLGKVPQNVSITLLSIDANTLQMLVYSTSLLGINTFIDSTLELSTDKKIERLRISSLIFDVEKGQYLLSLQADLP